jgi:hypothetical protein
MRTILHIIFLFFIIGFVACTVDQNNEPTLQQPVATTAMTPLPSVTATPLLSPTSLPTPTVTLTPTATDVPEVVETSTSFEPTLIATIQPDPYRRVGLLENVWWSDDSQTLYYQDIEAQQAWAYDLATGVSTSIPYVPRSFRELAPEIEAALPENASLLSLSPGRQYALYRLPLPEPIPVSGASNDDYPPYTYELWLHKDGQDVQLGLVDSSFGLLAPPIWSANENVAIVNTAGAPGVPYIYASWLIDLDALSVGRLDTPWEGVEYFYSVRDLSANGNLLLVRADINYFYNRETEEQWPIPDVATDRIVLIETDESFGCLISELEVSNTILRDHVWYCEPVIGKVAVLVTLEGNISQSVISPDKRFIAFTVTNQFPAGVEYRNIPQGIWLVALP